MPNETPASFVSRLARRNRLPDVRTFCADLGLDHAGIVAGRTSALEGLANLVGMPVSPLILEARHSENGRFRIRDQILLPGSLVLSRVRVCPACLAEDKRLAPGDVPEEVAPYARATWAVAHIRSCRDHGTAMVDLPVPSRAAAHDFACVFARGDGGLPIKAGRTAASEFELYLLDRLDGRSGPGWLDALPFYAAARICEVLGAVLTYGRDRPFNHLDEEDWQRAGQEGFRIASSGCDAIFEALVELWRSFPGDRATASGPLAWFGRLYRWLEYQTKDVAYDPVRVLLVRVVADRTPFNSNERMFGQPLPYRRLHSIRTASVETGLSPHRLRKALAKAGLLASGHEDKRDHEVTFDAAAASDLLRSVRASLTLAEAASALNASWLQARSLVRAGYLLALDADTAGAASSRIAADEVDAFMSKLRRGVSVVTAVPDGACDIRASTHRAQCSLEDVVGLVLSQNLSWVGHLADIEGLRSVLVKVEEVRAHVRRAELAGYTRRQIELALKVPGRTVNALVEDGILPTTIQPHPSVPRDVLIVAPDEFDRFRSRYMKLAEVAEAVGTSSRAIEARLASKGIEPALPREKYHTPFYDRRRIQAFLKLSC